MNNRNDVPQEERDNGVVRKEEQLASTEKPLFELENHRLRGIHDRHMNGKRFHFQHHHDRKHGIWGRLRHDMDPRHHHHHVFV